MDFHSLSLDELFSTLITFTFFNGSSRATWYHTGTTVVSTPTCLIDGQCSTVSVIATERSTYKKALKQ